MNRAPFKVCEKVYQVGGPELSSGMDCCVYLVDGSGRLALIDCGCRPGYKAIVANIIRLGFDPGDIGTVLLTHCHIDHVGAAARFKQDYGAELVAHELDARPLENGDRLLTAAFLYGVEFEPLRVDRKIASDEDEVSAGDATIQVLFTPGHTPGSLSAFLDTEHLRVLFGQDIHGPFHPDFGSDISAWRLSMERLLSLQADILCEGHFGVVSPSSAVRAYINGYLERFR